MNLKTFITEVLCVPVENLVFHDSEDMYSYTTHDNSLCKLVFDSTELYISDISFSKINVARTQKEYEQGVLRLMLHNEHENIMCIMYFRRTANNSILYFKKDK